MKICSVNANRKEYLPLLLMADEEEAMIDRYLERGEMYALCDPQVCAVCVVTDEGDGLLELKNLAVAPGYRRQGYGRAMIEFLSRRYKGQYQTLQVGTGDSPLTIPFYESCGFCRSHVIKDFFVRHYQKPIVEAGVVLRDMVYLRREI